MRHSGPVRTRNLLDRAKRYMFGQRTTLHVKFGESYAEQDPLAVITVCASNCETSQLGADLTH
jgi:hypothetical protein